jgi:phosphatidylserine decarboxylase
MMTIREIFKKIGAQEDINFLLTNRIPRITLTHFMGWFSQIRHPWVRDASIAVWKFFADLDLTEAKKTSFESLHDCFIRELKTGARLVNNDPDALTSPCDGIVGAMGTVDNGRLYQAKGFPYTLDDLLGDSVNHHQWRDGLFMTIRITSSMYHRFHGPYDGRLKQVRYFSGDTWNVNPIALQRVEKLFCKNERAFLKMEIGEARHQIALVPVAAVLVASIRLHALDMLFHTRYKGPLQMECDAGFVKGEELGWFQHGSTILIFVPKGFTIDPGLQEGSEIKMGQVLMRLPHEAKL